MHASVLDTIGRTPVLRLSRLSPNAALFAKLESANPGGSVKDRLALGIIEAAERSGALRPGQTVVEASSGNTGIALAMVCAAKGYPLVVVMAESFSVERRRLMRFLGARVVLTPAHLKGSAMVDKARELAERHGWFWCRQFENDANADMHARTTGPEILEAFRDRPLDAVVLGAGTGGTLRGVARALKAARPEVRIVVCEPDNAPLLASGRAQARHDDGSPAASHPEFRPHPLQGWTPDFIALHAGRAVDAGHVDRVLPVDGADALRVARQLARREGVLAGITAGATLAGGLQLLWEQPDAQVLCLLPDTAERYLSTPLFEDIGADMDADEWAISRSSPSARFDAAPAPAPAPAAAAALPTVDAEAEAWLSDAIAAQPVLVAALAWCEFGWTIRRLLDALGVPFRFIALDDPDLREGELGARVRAALHARTGSPRVPQVFVGGELVGDCDATLRAHASGELAARVARAGLPTDAWPDLDARSLLPRWRQPAAA